MSANAADDSRRTTRDAPVLTTKSTKRPSTRASDLKMALTVAFKHQSATGRGRFTQIVGRFEDHGLRLGTRFNRTVGKPGCIAAGDNQSDCKKNELTHDKA